MPSPPPVPPPRTTVTRLTPAGRGAVATLSVVGADALAMVSEFFRPRTGKPLSAGGIDQIRFGSWRHDRGGCEDVVVCPRAEDDVEVHCHGGDAAAEAIIAGLVSRGARVDDPESWLLRRHGDPPLARLRMMLAEARTERTAGILLDQLRGAWPRALANVVESLAASDRDAGALDKAAAQLQRLMDLGPLGRHLISPWQVVVAGLPNVGKSSLVNTMLGFSRCIVFDQPGTTRDIIAVDTALDGWPIELLDTAGLRAGEDAVESEGVARAVAKLATADLVLHLRDATQPPTDDLDPVIGVKTGDLRHGSAQVLTVESKADLVETPTRAADVRTSAVTKAGVDRLIEMIVLRLVPKAPAAGEAVPVTNAQCRLVADALAALDRGDVAAATEMLSRNNFRI